MGAGGPGQHYLWLDPELPADASVNVNWYIEQARLAEEARFDLIFIVASQFIPTDLPHRAGADHLAVGACRLNRAPRPGRDHDHLLQRPVQRRPPPRQPRPD